MNYFAHKLSQAEERIFSHVDIYQRAKLKQNPKDSHLTTVYNINSVLGSNQLKWVLGILSQKEDGLYYLEDGTYVV